MSKPNVLVIDDESGILDTLRILLKNEGFAPHTALGGRQGLEMIPQVAPDIVLSDVRMPSVVSAASRLTPSHRRSMALRRADDCPSAANESPSRCTLP